LQQIIKNKHPIPTDIQFSRFTTAKSYLKLGDTTVKEKSKPCNSFIPPTSWGIFLRRNDKFVNYHPKILLSINRGLRPERNIATKSSLMVKIFCHLRQEAYSKGNGSI